MFEFGARWPGAHQAFWHARTARRTSLVRQRVTAGSFNSRHKFVESIWPLNQSQFEECFVNTCHFHFTISLQKYRFKLPIQTNFPPSSDETTTTTTTTSDIIQSFHVELKCKRWISPLEKLAVARCASRHRLDRSRSPFSRRIFENCIDKRKQRIKGSQTKRKQKERRGAAVFAGPGSAGCQDKDSRRPKGVGETREAISSKRLLSRGFDSFRG